MKKLLTLFTLLLCVCSGAWATETEVWASDMKESITGVTQTKGRTSDTWADNTGLTWAPEGTYPSRFNAGGSSSALTFTFDNSVSVNENCVLRIYWGATSNRTLSVWVNGTDDNHKVGTQSSTPNSSVKVFEYEFTEDVDISSFKIGTSGGNTYFFKVEIVNLGEKSATGSTTITYNLTPNDNEVHGTTVDNRMSTITNLSNEFSASTLSIGSGNSKDGYSGQITGHAADYSATSYVALSFKVADGYVFEPSNAGITVFANGTSNMKTKVEISDGETTITSNELACSNSADSNISFADDAFTDKSLSGTVTIKIYQWGVTGKRAYIKSPVTISGTVSSATPKTSTTTTISGGSGLNKDIKNGTSAGTLSASVTVTSGGATVDGATVTWSSADTSIAEVNETTGAITLVAPGDVHITATYDGNETYASSFDTYELNVIDSRAVITPSLTYDNTTLILGQTTTATPTLTGNTGNGDVTYSSDNTDVATVDENTGVVTAVAIGTAHITASVAATSDYRAGSAQATITVANNPLGSKSITWTLSPINSANAELTSTSESTSIYLKNIGEINHSKVSLNSSPTKASNRTAKIDRTVGKDNDKYVFVTFDVEDGYYFIPSSISIKVANVSNVTTFDAELIDENDVTVGESEKTFSSTDGKVETWVINNSDNDKAMSGTVTLKIYGYAETEGTYRFGDEIVIEGNVTRVVPVTISSIGYGTWASDNKLDFAGTSIKAYKATVTGTTVDFTQVNVVPAGEGVLLYAAGGATVNVPVTTADADDFAGNKLVRGTGDALTYAAGTAEYYILANETAGIGFYKANNNTVATNRAYLDLTGANAKSITMPGGETDGIRSIDNSELRVENSNYYNLAGQRVGKDYKGIVIVNGKKMLNK